MLIYKCETCIDRGWIESGHYNEDGSWVDDGAVFCPFCNPDGKNFPPAEKIYLIRADGEEESLTELEFNLLKNSGDLHELYPTAPETFNPN